jgi:SAM-dependent methyltransferase
MKPKDSRDSILARSQKYYARRVYYYELLSQRPSAVKQTTKELDFLEKAFKTQASRRVKSVLDIACGRGRHIVGLAQRGYDCTGRDLTPECVQVAKSRAERAGVAVDLSEGNATKLPEQRKFDAVLALYILFLLPKDDDVLSCLSQIQDILLPGGVLVCNIFNPFTTSKNGIIDLIRLGHQVNEYKARGIRFLEITKPIDFDPIRGAVWVEENTVIQADDGPHVFQDREHIRLLTYWDTMHYLHAAGFDSVEAYPDWSTKFERKAKAEQIVFVARK